MDEIAKLVQHISGHWSIDDS